MGKAIFAMIATVLVGFVSCAVFASWVNAPEWGWAEKQGSGGALRAHPGFARKRTAPMFRSSGQEHS